MRCGVLTKLLLACAGVPLLGGCGLPRLNEGRQFAVYSAGYAGRFHIAYGRWPTLDELEEFVCMRGRADGFGLAQVSCDALVSKPYRTQITPQVTYLEMRFFDLDTKPVCDLRVLIPKPRDKKDLFPMVVIKTRLFSCRGNGERTVE